MSVRELPVYTTGRPFGDVAHLNGTGAAVTRPRDAYRNVPILARPTWGHLISAYFFLGGVSSGAFTLGSLALVGGRRRRRLSRAAHVTALITLLPCPPLLIADLGKPARFPHMLRIFKPSSPMNLGAWTLTAHGGFAAMTVLVDLAHARKLPILGPLGRLVPESAFAVAGVPTALALGGYTGVLLGTTSVPAWSTSPLLGALFMASSLSTGLAAVALAATLSGPGKEGTERPLSALGFTFTAAELSLLLGYLATSAEAVKPLLHGRQGLLLRAAAAALGLSAALDAFHARRPVTPRSTSLPASVATLVAGALLRIAVVGAGAASAEDREGTLKAMRSSPGNRGWGPGTES